MNVYAVFVQSGWCFMVDTLQKVARRRRCREVSETQEVGWPRCLKYLVVLETSITNVRRGVKHSASETKTTSPLFRQQLRQSFAMLASFINSNEISILNQPEVGCKKAQRI